jgi:hypothetical protein
MTGTKDETLPNANTILQKMQQEYEALMATVKRLNEAQIAESSMPTDWSVKDHLAHLAVWSMGIVALFNLESRWDAMGLDPAFAEGNGDYDALNAVIYEQHKNRAWSEVLAFFNASHQQFTDKIEAASDEGLLKPYGDYNPAAVRGKDKPIVYWVIGDSYEHYAEHHQWIREMLTQKGWLA